MRNSQILHKSMDNLILELEYASTKVYAKRILFRLSEHLK